MEQIQLDTVKPGALLKALLWPNIRPNTLAERFLFLLADGRWRTTGSIADELNIGLEQVRSLKFYCRRAGHPILGRSREYRLERQERLLPKLSPVLDKQPDEGKA